MGQVVVTLTTEERDLLIGKLRASVRNINLRAREREKHGDVLAPYFDKKLRDTHSILNKLEGK